MNEQEQEYWIDPAAFDRRQMSAEIKRLRDALQKISDMTPFYEPWADIAREALEHTTDGQ